MHLSTILAFVSVASTLDAFTTYVEIVGEAEADADVPAIIAELDGTP